MDQNKSNQNKRRFPKRENLPYTHQPDQDGRTDYGKDQETTYKG